MLSSELWEFEADIITLVLAVDNYANTSNINSSSSLNKSRLKGFITIDFEF